MTRYLYGALALFLLAIAGLATLFWIQNSTRTTQLSLELWSIGAWQLSQPVSVPVLIAASFGAGLLLGAGPLGLKLLGLQRRVSALQRQVAVQPTGGASEWRR